MCLAKRCCRHGPFDSNSGLSGRPVQSTGLQGNDVGSHSLITASPPTLMGNGSVSCCRLIDRTTTWFPLLRGSVPRLVVGVGLPSIHALSPSDGISISAMPSRGIVIPNRTKEVCGRVRCCLNWSSSASGSVPLTLVVCGRQVMLGSLLAAVSMLVRFNLELAAFV